MVPIVPLQAGLGALLALVSLVVWIAVVVAIFDIRRATKRTADATERLADAMASADDVDASDGVPAEASDDHEDDTSNGRDGA